MNNYVEQKAAGFTEVIDFFKKDISSLRTGRAHQGILENVHVDAYGSKTPLQGVGNISVVDSKCMLISPWDRTLCKDIEKALVEADLGLGIINEGDKIRLTVPAMTEENRKDLVKKINEKMEKTKISIRQLREEVHHAIEEAGKDKEIGEDDKFRYLKEMEEFVTKKIEELKELRDRKEKEIMEI